MTHYSSLVLICAETESVNLLHPSCKGVINHRRKDVVIVVLNHNPKEDTMRWSQSNPKDISSTSISFDILARLNG